MKDSPANIGLTTNQLQKVFPYHVAVNKSFEIIQVGHNLMDILHYKNVLGASISDIFDIKCPLNCAFEWFEIIMKIDCVFSVSLKPSLLTEKNHKEVASLNLKGKVVLQTQEESDGSHATMLSSTQGAIFLLELNVSSSDELQECSYNMNKVTSSSSQKKSIRNGK